MLFFLLAALILAWNAWRGWRMGVVRQVVGIVGAILAWVVAYFGASFTAPFLQPLGLPDHVLSAIGGVLLGLAVFAVISIGSAIVFKNTSQQGVGVIRWGYGGLGALVGLGSGLVKVWILMLSVRLLGSVAQTGIQVAQGSENVERRTSNVERRSKNLRAPDPNFDVRRSTFDVRRSPPPPPPAWVRSLAGMKSSIDRGITGTVADHLDPIPTHLYTTLDKIGRVVGSERHMDRFLAYPGVKPLTQNPKIVALQNDPAIHRAALDRDYLTLLRDERVVAALNDPALAALLRHLEFEKALDFALQEKPAMRK